MADDVARQALMDAGSEDAVTVNQRALIDKILARYAAEFTVWRELLQNASDSGATHCQLRFETLDYQAIPSALAETYAAPPLLELDLKAPLKKWVFKNNGRPFSDDDWSRLRRIAEGNPDPDKVGAFGVGFYSLFSICEEPVVASGAGLMGFFWKNGGDSLFTRRAENPDAANDLSPTGVPWTSFYMTLRETSSFSESPLQLTRFLATSMTFAANIQSLELWFDGYQLCKLQKSMESIRPILMPSYMNAASPERMMRVERLESQGIKISAQVLAIVWEDEKERIRAEKAKARRPNLVSALTKAGGLTSILQNAFGGRAKDRASPGDTAASEASGSSPSSEDAPIRRARLLTPHSATAHLKIATSHIAISVDAQYRREIQRSTKKAPPAKTTFSIIWVGKDEYDAIHSPKDPVIDVNDVEVNLRSTEVGPQTVFEGLMPKLDKMGHVFIGFRTHQTTGFAGHVAARFIPTVERESIDFIDRHCARWNLELLAIGGYTCRAVYEAEMESLRKLWRRGEDEVSKTLRANLLAKALYCMQFFTLRDSSPSLKVSNTLCSAFFGSSRQSIITLASTQGVQTSSGVRLPNAALLEFIKSLAVVPPDHIEQASEFFDQVRSRNLVKDITLEDVFGELSSRSLDAEEAVSCLRWWINVSAHPGYDSRLRGRLVDSAILSIDRENLRSAKVTNFVQSLASVNYFLNPQRIPLNMPLPPSCLAPEVSKYFTGAELARVFGWSEFGLPSWIDYLASLSSKADCPIESNIQLSPVFSEKVFGVVSRAWGNLSGRQQQDLVSALTSLSCVPTKKGMQRPNASYFANVSLFEDLAIVEFPTASVKGNLEKVLIALDVRRHVDLQLIFTRLVGGGDWSHVDLLTYLASNRESLSSIEIDRLRKTPIWPKEREMGSLTNEGKGKIVRYRASQLYEPSDALRQLGLPILDWSSQASSRPWRSGSDEAKFAFTLGLQKHPSLREILALASLDDAVIGSKALLYFFEKQIYRDTYDPKAASQHAFVPCRVNGPSHVPEMTRLRPTEVFTNPEAAMMRFPIVAGVNALDVTKLHLRSDPPPAMLVSKLVNHPPTNLSTAKAVFEYLASVQSAFSSHDLAVLKQAAFIPVPTTAESQREPNSGSAQCKLVSPNLCYFGGNDTVQAFRSVFLYVPDLGSKANSFLRLVGVSDEPSIEEVAARLIAEPTRFYTLSGSVEAYLALLRQVAANWNRIKSPLLTAMKQSAFLLASKRVKDGGPPSGNSLSTKANTGTLLDDTDDEENGDAEDAGILVHTLRRPIDIVIADDANAGMIFGANLFFAPHEDLLEQGLYHPLGCPRLSSLVEERYEMAGSAVFNSRRASDIRALIVERTPLFLFETRQSGNREDIKRESDWLKTTLEVIEIGGDGLRLSRILCFQGQQQQNVQRASAMAKSENNKVRLFVAANMQIDWFEVAAALNKFLLSRQRLQEVLLFMTLLSTSLRDLKRRGFHVDKILQQRKADREAAEQQRLDEQRQMQLDALNKPSDRQFDEWGNQLAAMFPDADLEFIRSLLRRQKVNHLEQATNLMLTRDYPCRAHIRSDSFEKQRKPAADGLVTKRSDATEALSQAADNGFFSSFRNRLQRHAIGPSTFAAATPCIEHMNNDSINMPGGFEPRHAIAQSSKARSTSIRATSNGVRNNPAEQPSSLDSIRRNVLSAISASRPDQSTNVRSQEQHMQVKEAESSYCDSTGMAANLNLAGEVAGMRVFLSPELDPATTLPSNKDALDRLINLIYRPVGAIFGLNPKSMHVFVDVTGPTIAFNRGGTIWLNLRYYLAWHDEAVRQGDLTDALISTYFSVAHEIAHNIEQQHNAQHEVRLIFATACAGG